MDGNAFASRDVSDDLFATNRIAALRAVDQQFVKARDLELGVGADAEHPLDGACQTGLRLSAADSLMPSGTRRASTCFAEIFP